MLFCQKLFILCTNHFIFFKQSKIFVTDIVVAKSYIKQHTLKGIG